MILSQLDLTKDQKLALFKALAQDEEIRPEVGKWFDSMLLTSELRPVQRIREVEKVTGLYVFEEFEEHEATIPEKIEAMEEKIKTMESQPWNNHVSTMEQTDFIPETKTEKTAVELAKFAVTLPVIEGKKSLTPKLFHHFRKHVLPEELRPNTVNPRQWKKDISEKMIDLFAGIKTDKKGNNRGIRLMFPTNFSVGMLKCKANVS